MLASPTGSSAAWRARTAPRLWTSELATSLGEDPWPTRSGGGPHGALLAKMDLRQRAKRPRNSLSRCPCSAVATMFSLFSNSPKSCQEACTKPTDAHRLQLLAVVTASRVWVGIEGKPHLVPSTGQVRNLRLADISVWRASASCAAAWQSTITFADFRVHGGGDTLTTTLSIGPSHTTVFRVRFEARFVQPTQGPPAKSDHVLMPFCAPADPVGPAFPALQAPVSGSGLDPPVLPACSAPHDEPSRQPLWLASKSAKRIAGLLLFAHCQEFNSYQQRELSANAWSAERPVC